MAKSEVSRFYFGEDNPVFEAKEQFRLHDIELKQINKVVKHARDEANERKYKNNSHFYRAAIMEKLRQELKKLDIKRGRPKK